MSEFIKKNFFDEHSAFDITGNFNKNIEGKKNIENIIKVMINNLYFIPKCYEVDKKHDNLCFLPKDISYYDNKRKYLGSLYSLNYIDVDVKDITDIIVRFLEMYSLSDGSPFRITFYNNSAVGSVLMVTPSYKKILD